MANKILAILLGIILHGNAVQAQTPLPHVSSGKIIRQAAFISKYLPPRNIDIWLPENYFPGEPVAVLYMHDGQMLFDSTTTWNKQEWGVDETLSRLMKQQVVKRCMVVGIWNTPERRREYFPEKAFNTIPLPLKDSILQDIGGMPISDRYLKFITKELKPFIDSTFRPLTDASNTCIAGSSMGALISLYAICEYPEIFGAAACISTHWPGSVYRNTTEVPDAFIHYISTHMPLDKKHYFYFDRGTTTLDAWYGYGRDKMNHFAKKAGLSAEQYTSLIYQGANHTEKAWQQRLDIPLRFLLHR